MNMKHQLLISAMLLLTPAAVYAQDYFDDDIYYNPKKSSSTSQKKKSAYIPNMADMDVDAYNRRGEQYYASPVDTIGTYVENGEDFVYTQQIQKYYNPTIVVDNADVLGDVLENAYGNVEIVIDNNGLPVFSPYYGWNYPYYAGWWSSPSWGLSINPWGWSIGFYDPWYSWGWRPSYAWGWGPGWGPGWGWGPSCPGHPGGRPPMANYRPNGNRPVGPNSGWSNSTRPGGGGNLAHRVPGGNSVNRPGSTSTRPGLSARPGVSMSRPGGAGVVNNNGRWEYNTTNSMGHRQAGTGVVNNSGGNNRVNSVKNGATTNRRATNNVNRSNMNTQKATSNTRNYNNTNRTTNRNNGSFNTGRTNRGGGFGGGSRNTGGGSRRGGGGGRHR